ncbi:hypothetical protein Acid345_2478 [Candidatus Koribacter versatilis Ellin345]|uniref:Uncharacterized protein n=1 Tax=Koribacter versatilis (strain Ellin345) TaxID=204669 RepID=Q1INS1_KORVE|nr:hypothetical protein [Candidatus Koribacter versatilis]ABF41479.1 hypothetical protein Acid345_2478 [Candidatus Koribacter versatilis Ellin345]
MFRLGLLALALTTAALAQQNLPGTVVTNAPQQMVPSARPLVTTPTMTLSNGFSPATVTMPQTLVTEQPATVVTGPANNNMPQGEGVSTVAEAEAAADFDVAAAATGSAFNVGIAGPSLADIARQSKKYQVQAHKTYSNEDVDRMNQQTSNGGNGIISATHGDGQPIVARNTGFEPSSGIANMPDAAGSTDETQMANNPSETNPMSEGQTNATASNADQGQQNTQQATTPAAQAPANGQEPAQQQMPANDNPR